MNGREARVTIYTLLHVSDVHFGVPNRMEQPLITSRLVKAAHKHCRDGAGTFKPDLCIFSGDLAHSGQPEQFKQGGEWLRKLTAPFGCKTFIVPGNHDVSRPNATSKLLTDLQAAYPSEENYDKYRDQLQNVETLQNFRDWTAANKNELKLVSDWSGSPFGCSFRQRIKGLDVVIIGLNSSILSCEDKEKGHLVIDKTIFNELIAEVDTEKDLVIAVSHHPIGGVKNSDGDLEERWLAKWNSVDIENQLLYSSGPHIYLHGHLHDAKGTSVSYTQGFNLSFFGAGASYDHASYPKKFAFYEIDTVTKKIRPYVYVYSDGDWRFDYDGSHSTNSVLPTPRGITESSTVAKLAGLQCFTRAVISSYQTLGQELRKCVPRFAPELENLFSPVIRSDLREKEHQRNGYKILLEDIEDALNAEGLCDPIGRALLRAKTEIESRNLEGVISLLRSEELTAQTNLLLTALSISEDPRHWDEANRKIETYGGSPWHYVTLSYNLWSIDDLEGALSLGERAKTAYAQETKRNSGQHKQPEHKLWNNLAYFYAEEGNDRKAALRYAMNAVKAVRREQSANSRDYANYLDTEGYCRIVFASSGKELEQGIKKCEEARRKGASLALYFRHIACAERAHEGWKG